MAADCGISRELFQRLAHRYHRHWGVGLCAADPEGHVALAFRAQAWTSTMHQEGRRLAIHESLRWGEPVVELSADEVLIWGVPLMHNEKLLGGLIAGVSERRLFPDEINSPSMDIRGACADLLGLVEQHNLTNATLLDLHRRQSQQERIRAEAIHAFKASPHYDIRALYLLEEPLLIAAIRKGDRGEARSILNRLLVGMIHRAGSRLDLVKSFFMELVSMMSRTAVEAGGVPEELLGSNYSSLAQLAAIGDEQPLAGWLREMLERIMDSIRRHAPQANSLLLSNALRYMAEHCSEQIGRDEAARAASMSPSHFSRQFQKHFGQSFTEALNRMRSERAADLLLRSDKPLKLICLECGFTDQSYMTKVFRRRYGLTPARYRREHQITKV
ncbi:MAG: helix-turn-helix domain-containing protein [Bacillota bacterium]